ncbi:hypothetical protein CBL_07276 [Carabus blaptoides fortunei]
MPLYDLGKHLCSGGPLETVKFLGGFIFVVHSKEPRPGDPCARPLQTQKETASEPGYWLQVKAFVLKRWPYKGYHATLKQSPLSSQALALSFSALNEDDEIEKD